MMDQDNLQEIYRISLSMHNPLSGHLVGHGDHYSCGGLAVASAVFAGCVYACGG